MAVFRSPVMVGRDRELDRLRQIAVAVERAEPAFVVIEGEPGVGKTRLATEFAAGLGSALVLSGHGVRLRSGDLPFGILSEVLRDLVRAVGVDRVTSVLGDEERVLVGLVPALAESRGEVGPVDRAGVFGAAAELLQRLAEDRLVVVILEDLQWADRESLDVVEYISRVAHDCRLLVVATVRTGDATEDRFADRLADLHRLPQREVVVLERLSRGAVAEQVHLLLGPDGDEATVSRICRLSEGVPFLAEELAVSGVTGGRALPAAVRRLVLARLPELDEDARDVLDAATVGEAHAQHRLLRRVTGMDGSRFEAATAQAIGVGVLEVTEDGQAFRFRHVLLREALDQVMHPSRRIHLHQRWARTLGEDHAPLSATEAAIVVAQHWDAAGDVEETLRSAIPAAQASAQLSAAKQEAEFWQRAFGLWPADHEDVNGVGKGEVAVRLLRAREVAFQVGEALDWCRTTLRSGVDNAGLELCLRLNAQNYAGLLGAPGFGFATADTVPALVEQLASMGCSWPVMDAIWCLWTAFPERQAELFDRVIGLLDPMSRELGDEHMISAVIQSRGWSALQTGRTDDALRRAEDGLEHARNLPPQEVRIAETNLGAEANLMWVLLAQGRAAEAVDIGAEALRTLTAPEANPSMWSSLAVLQGRGLLALGHLDRVRDLIALAAQVAGPDRLLRRTPMPLQMRVDARRGDLPAAVRMLEDLGSEAESVKDRWESIWSWSWPWAWTVYADVAFASGDLRRLEPLRPLLGERWLIRSSEWTWELVLNALRAVVCPLSGRPGPVDEALEFADAADRLHRHGELGRAWVLEVVALRGRTTGSDTSAAWLPAVEAWEHIGYRFDEAVCRLRLGECLLREGHRGEADEQLTRTLGLAHALGAKPLTEAARRTARLTRLRLGDTSIGPRGAASLTVREIEVLALAAQGRTNEQIAAELFMSPKTASVHISRIISKLGVANRTEAAAYAYRHGLIEP